MQTTDCKQDTKCSVHSTDMLGTKSLDCDKNCWKQILVTNCEDAGFIFYFGKIKVNNVMQPTKNRKGLIQCRATWFLVFCCMFYVDFSFSFLLFFLYHNNNNNNNIFNQGKPISWSCYKWVPCIFSSYLKWQPNF